MYYCHCGLYTHVPQSQNCQVLSPLLHYPLPSVLSQSCSLCRHKHSIERISTTECDYTVYVPVDVSNAMASALTALDSSFATFCFPLSCPSLFHSPNTRFSTGESLATNLSNSSWNDDRGLLPSPPHKAVRSGSMQENYKQQYNMYAKQSVKCWVALQAAR